MESNNESMVVRLALFAGGMLLVVFGIILLMPLTQADSTARLFATCNVIALYALVFGPLLLGDFASDATGGRVVFAGIFTWALVPYALLSVVLTHSALVAIHPPLSLYVVVQLAAFFVLVIMAFWGGMAAQHITRTERHDAAVRSSLDRLRFTVDQISACLAGMEPNNAAQTKLADDVELIAEELRYLSPVHTPEAHSVEEQIAIRLDALLGCVQGQGLVTGGQDGGELRLAQEALVLIDRRKALRSW